MGGPPACNPGDARVAADEFIAYALPGLAPVVIEPADLKRPWQEGDRRLGTAGHPALARGNQAGWVLRCPISITFTWNGDPRPFHGILGTSMDPDRARYQGYFSNHFGHGIVTFSIPYLFRTPPGHGLLVRGPANHWVEGVTPLDGLVEADWLESTFTMNWRIQAPHRPVSFQKGEPLLMVVPFPLDMLEQVEPVLRHGEPWAVGEAPEVAADGTWQHAWAADTPAIATEDLPGKARLRLKRPAGPAR
ncbi:MAG: DUF6065 family protein [Candidatus Sericytochromatia bacterium]|nr:DUF6065 family protein [Candidatus Sericytochromatia bacterium]